MQGTLVNVVPAVSHEAIRWGFDSYHSLFINVFMLCKFCPYNFIIVLESVDKYSENKNPYKSQRKKEWIYLSVTSCRSTFFYFMLSANNYWIFISFPKWWATSHVCLCPEVNPRTESHMSCRLLPLPPDIVMPFLLIQTSSQEKILKVYKFMHIVV